MKPVVSSLVALAIAIAPMTAFAAKPSHPKTHVKHKASSDKATGNADKSGIERVSLKDKDKDEGKASRGIVRVKAGKKDGAHVKPAVHHAHNVNLGGPGHKEPKEGQGAIVAASMRAPLPTTTTEHGKPSKATKASAPSGNQAMPRLPDPNAGKPSKGGAEKGARKSSSQKHEASESDSDGEPTRDGDLAELVARIRGHQSNEKDPGMKSEEASSASSERSAKSLTRTASKSAAPPCRKEPVEIVRGPEVDRFELTKCDGTIAPLAIEHLSIMIRPGGAARPTAPVAELARKAGAELAHGVRRVDPRLVERLQSVVDHFGKPGSPAKVLVISGYRPASIGSMHSTGRAVDFRVDGARNEDVVAFCKTLDDTGCGFYPNSSFVHVDIREKGAGHVSWIDVSGPGETPRYVTSWPPPREGEPATEQGLEKTSMTRTEAATSRAPSAERLAEEGESLLRARRPAEPEGEPASEPAEPGAESQ